MSSRKPNFLFIMADQLAAQWLPSYGHPLVKAPNISALAEAGSTFDSAYCPFPLCAPARCSMLSGTLSSRIEVYDNGAEFHASRPTLLHYLRILGYRTILSGKMHFVGADQLHGYEERLTTDIYPSDFGWTVDWSSGTRERPTTPMGTSLRSVVEAGVCTRSMQMDFDDDAAYQARRKIFELARDPNRAPFFLTVSFTHPHNPFVTSKKYWDLYNHGEIEHPAFRGAQFNEWDAHSKRLYFAFRMDEYKVRDEDVRNARHAYYGMVSYLDERIGELLRALKEAKLADDTIVIFTSDHGEMLGERGLWYKSSFFEPSVRVPLIMRVPGTKTQEHINSAVSTMDLLPTILELAGADCESILATAIDGRSVAPLLWGKEYDSSRVVAAEYTGEGSVAPCVMLRKGRFKYVHCEEDPPLLYDLGDDPEERKNLSGSPKYAETETWFRDEVPKIWNLKEYREAVVWNQKQRLLVQQALALGRKTAWDYQPIEDAARQYVRSGANPTAIKSRARFPYVEPKKPDFPRVE